MESCLDTSRGQELSSLKVDDSNTIMLPGKKNNKKGKNKVSRKPKTNRNTELSKSQKRKLKKLQDDKEKELLFSKSIETLEKYKIGEDAYSLMWSSRNLGKVETVREKRRRQVQFSKAGLELPNNDRPIKRKDSDSTCEMESDSHMVQLRQMCNDSDSSCPVIGEREVLHDISVCGSAAGCVNGYDASMSVQETSYKNNETSVLGDLQNSLSISSSKNVAEMEKSTDTINEYLKGNLSSMSNLADGPPHRALAAPVVVHVARPKEIENKRKDLPIVMMEQEIMEAINDNISVIICGETGCGKTTQVPQFLYEAGFGSSRCSVHSGMIGVTQPRRVAVLATAKRVAFELGLRLGKEVGFQVRYDKRIGDSCSIKFMTDGILLRELQNDILLKRYSIIILDEAHERSLNTDILIGMLSRIIQERQKYMRSKQIMRSFQG